MLGHGKAGVVDAYTDKPFQLLFRPLRRYRRFLQPVFDKVAEPFPEGKPRAKNVSVSRGTIIKMQELRAQGRTLKEVAHEVGVCVQTVQRYVRKQGADRAGATAQDD
jgi:hypothetical protein